MDKIVLVDTVRVKKRQQISFRRWIAGHGGDSIAPYVGIDKPACRAWIASQFIKGMNWSNYGSVWVIDHIVPLRLFDLYDDQQLKIAWNYTNLMPLLKEDNVYKEGNMVFALQILSNREKTDIVNTLLAMAYQENNRLSKYLYITPQLYIAA